MTSTSADGLGFPYPDFANNPLMYDQSTAFWEDAFAEAAMDHEWVGWMEDPLRDGNPIFSKLNRRLARGVLVQQVARSDDPVWFKCWVSHFGAPGPDRLPYLFVETFISLPARDHFQTLVRRWSSPTIGEAEVERLTDRLRRKSADTYAVTDFDLQPRSLG